MSGNSADTGNSPYSVQQRAVGFGWSGFFHGPPDINQALTEYARLASAWTGISLGVAIAAMMQQACWQGGDLVDGG